DRADTARTLVNQLRSRVNRIAHLTSQVSRRPRVTLLEWLDPLYSCGHWTPELVSLAGGEEGHSRPGGRSRLMTWDEVRSWDPEVIVVACCGYEPARALQEFPLLERLPGYHGLSAVRTGRVHAVDGVGFFSRPGPRLVESLELLAHLLHPSLVASGPAG